LVSVKVLLQYCLKVLLKVLPPFIEIIEILFSL